MFQVRYERILPRVGTTWELGFLSKHDPKDKPSYKYIYGSWFKVRHLDLFSWRPWSVSDQGYFLRYSTLLSRLIYLPINRNPILSIISTMMDDWEKSHQCLIHCIYPQDQTTLPLFTPIFSTYSLLLGGFKTQGIFLISLENWNILICCVYICLLSLFKALLRPNFGYFFW